MASPVSTLLASPVSILFYDSNRSLFKIFFCIHPNLIISSLSLACHIPNPNIFAYSSVLKFIGRFINASVFDNWGMNLNYSVLNFQKILSINVLIRGRKLSEKTGRCQYFSLWLYLYTLLYKRRTVTVKLTGN